MLSFLFPTWDIPESISKLPARGPLFFYLFFLSLSLLSFLSHKIFPTFCRKLPTKSDRKCAIINFTSLNVWQRFLPVVKNYRLYLIVHVYQVRFNDAGAKYIRSNYMPRRLAVVHRSGIGRFAGGFSRGKTSRGVDDTVTGVPNGRLEDSAERHSSGTR